ncbi:MAG: dihydrolipoyl dehydrogenase [Burkholderiales bacterium]
MNQLNVDVAVIGAGTAGLAAYRTAVAAGARAVIIEGGPYGTTCARVGCMPSKLLIAAADAAHAASRWPAFGIELHGSISIDGRAVMKRVRAERDRFVGFVIDGVERIPAGDKVRGFAKFSDDHHVVVDDHSKITFTSAVIATGSSPTIPPFLTSLGDRVIVNDDVFQWQDLPRSVAVFGPGVIGLELGQALARLGVKVVMFGREGYLGPFSDPRIREYAIQAFQQEFQLDTDAKILAVARSENGVTIRHLNFNGAEATAEVDYVIAATGRAPNVANIGIENTSIFVNKRGVPLFDRYTLQSGASNIFIAGDANNDVPVLHEAADEGRIAGANAARFPDVKQGKRREPFAVVFTDPQIAAIGQPLGDLKPGSFVVGEASFEEQGRSRIMLRDRGLLHVYADVDTGGLLGAEMFGPDAEHIAHLLAWVIQLDLTVEQVLALPFYHPVVEEGLRTALRDAAAKRLAAVANNRQAA